MKGWQVKNLNEICEIARGGSPRPIKEFLTNDSNGINWIKISDATASNKYIYQTKEKIKPEGIKYSRLVEEGDFILSNSMSFGRPYIMKTSGCIHDGWLVLHDKSGLFDQDYLYYFLGSNATYNQFDSLAAGSTVRNLNINLVSGLKVLLPPLEEQKRIVAILDEAFEGIDAAIANTQKNLANARELFESYLNGIFTRKGDVEIAGWKNTKIEHLFTVKSGHFLPKKNMKDGKFDVYGGNGIIGKHNQFNLTGENILIGRVGAKCGNVQRVNRNIWITDNAFYISEVFEEFNLTFLEYLLSIKNLRKTANHAAQPVISYQSIKNITLPVPPLEEQRRIVAILDELRAETQRLESIYQRKLEALQELKQSILQKAFTGELTGDTAKEVADTSKEIAA